MRSRRAFTLLEVMVAVGISTLLLTGLIMWVSSIMRSTTTAVNLASTARDARFTAALLGDDVLRARSCDPSGFGPIVASSTPDTIVFFADVVDAAGLANYDGIADQVTWSAADGSLRRGVVAGTGLCPSEVAEPAGFLTVAPAISAVDEQDIFTVYENASPAPHDATCLAPTSTCRYDAVRIRARVVDAASSASPTTFDSTYTIPTTSRRQ